MSTIGSNSGLVRGGRKWPILKCANHRRTLFRPATHRQRVAAIILVGMLAYGGMIAVDGLVMRPWLNSSFGPTPDLAIYQERTSLILNGGIIYRDLDIESPPLINYALLPAQMIGGDWWAYEAYFSFFVVLTALSMYLIMRRWNSDQAMLAALLFLLCPFALQDATWGIQDEPMVAFFYLFPVLLFLSGRKGTSAVAAALGFWIKFLPVIIYPDVLVKLKDRRRGPPERAHSGPHLGAHRPSLPAAVPHRVPGISFLLSAGPQRRGQRGDVDHKPGRAGRVSAARSGRRGPDRGGAGAVLLPGPPVEAGHLEGGHAHHRHVPYRCTP